MRTQAKVVLTLMAVLALGTSPLSKAEYDYPMNEALFVPLEQDPNANVWKAILFVLDISGSMSGARINSVRKTLSKAATKMPKDAGIGLVSFSGCSSSDVRLEVPVAPGAGAQVVARANALRPRGSTDIYGGMKMAEAEAKRLGKSWCLKVMLLSDGGDTCNKGNYKKVAKDLMAVNKECNQISAISIGAPAWESDVFDEITKIGRGTHKAVDKAADVEDLIEMEMRQFRKHANGEGWTGEYKEGEKPGKEPGKKYDKGKKPPTNEQKTPEELELERKKKLGRGGNGK